LKKTRLEVYWRLAERAACPRLLFLPRPGGGRMRVIRTGRLLKQFDIKIEQTLMFYDPKVVAFNGEPMLVLELDMAQVRRRISS